MIGQVPILIAALAATSALLFSLSAIPVKSRLSKRIEELESLSVDASPDRMELFERIFSQEHRSRLARELEMAGWYTTTPAQIGLRVISGVLIGVIATLTLIPLLRLQPVLAIPLVAIVTVCSGYAPIYLLHRAIDARKQSIQARLPDFLDMVATTVRAGLAMNAALGYAVDAAPGALGDELRAALAEIRLGRSRASALRAMAERADVSPLKTTVTAIVQAERLGANIAHVLADLAEESRNARLLAIEEEATKLPVKMAFPMALFMLPAIFVVIFGTLAANFFAHR